MYRSLIRCAGWRNMIGLGSSTSRAQPSGATQQEENDYDETNNVDDQTTLENEADYLDSIRARGFLKHRYKYQPPIDLAHQISEVVREVSETESEDWRSMSLTSNPVLKFKLLSLMEKRLGHGVPNSRLHELKTVSNVIEYYQEPVSNITNYTQLAREDSIPKNLTIKEQPFLFHPDDKDAFHRGITAFPGKGGKVYGMRAQRLYRQFNPKKEWYDWKDSAFDYSRPPKDAPWDPEETKKLDRPRLMKPKRFY